jgi:hypothetical protein
MHIVANAATAVTPIAIGSAYDPDDPREGSTGSDAIAKTAMAESAAINAIAVAQCSTTESGELARRTVCAPRKT